MRSAFLSPALLCLALLGAGGGAMAANLNHHYSFQSGVTDLAGNMNGMLFGNANLAGGVLNLDGVNAWAEFGGALVPVGGSYSVALFAKGAAVQTGYTELISQGQSGSGFYIGTDNSGAMIRASDGWTTTGVPFGTPGVWTHYALVVDSVNVVSRLYVNGVQAAQVPYAIVTSTVGTPTRLGRQFSPFAEFFNGSIDEVRTYDGVLTPQEVAVLANPVPEPSTGLLMALGAGALYLARRRRA